MLMPGQGDPNDPNNPFGIPAGLLASAAMPGQPGSGMAQGLMQMAGQGPRPGTPGSSPMTQQPLAPAARPATLPGPAGGSPLQNALFDGGAASLANPQTGTTLTRAIGEALQAGKASFTAHADREADTKALQQQVDSFRATLNNPKLADLLGQEAVDTFKGMPAGEAMAEVPKAIAAAKAQQNQQALETQRAKAATSVEAQRAAATEHAQMEQQVGHAPDTPWTQDQLDRFYKLYRLRHPASDSKNEYQMAEAQVGHLPDTPWTPQQTAAYTKAVNAIRPAQPREGPAATVVQLLNADGSTSVVRYDPKTNQTTPILGTDGKPAVAKGSQKPVDPVKVEAARIIGEEMRANHATQSPAGAPTGAPTGAPAAAPATGGHPSTKPMIVNNAPVTGTLGADGKYHYTDPKTNKNYTGQ